MDEVREHSFDGIEEYDNPLPRWWLYLFYFTIVFAVGYAWYYPTLWFYGGNAGWSQAAQYEQQMAEAAKRWPAPVAGAGADLTALMHDPTALAAGQKIFGQRCAVCHGKEAEGKIGPSLKDADWKYGGDSASVMETIEKGRPGGMPPWGKVLSPEQLQQVSAYVLSLSGGQASADVGPRS